METWHDKANNDDKVTKRKGDKEIRKSGDEKMKYQCLETKRQGDKETRRERKF